jgi:DNA-directed RNA polymerase specialized sigma24 family protein
VAWSEVDRQYRRAIEAFGLRLGLSDADAEDVAQESLAALACAIRDRRFDPAVSDVSNFLFAVARRRVALVIRKRYGAPGRVLRLTDEWIDTVPETLRERAIWEQTWAVTNLSHCLDIVRTRTDPAKFRMFIQRIRACRSVGEIAQKEGVDSVEVYKAVYEVKLRLRELLEGVRHDPNAA